jgi:hypothetical protein
LPDGERPQSEDLEQRFKYAARFEKLLRRPQAQEVLDILRLYGAECIPIPRRTERWYWSVSCLPSTDKSLARVNASWMELFALLPDARPEQGRRGEDLLARFILHLSDQALLESCVARPGARPERSRRDVTHFFWKADTFGIKVRGGASIRAFIVHPHGLRAIRRFNLTHMNRGRNAYQASHCYSLADVMVGD